ncbi:hypothetical protein [Roseomonas sp. 18066]|uniref:hypothetical protein n=1 Tax=Roseomonas sp. 18066 TaxID=2681412 RepID=UPI00135864DB|nr:hypothetical protein [Roseomonas sp. 18066]
MRNFLPMLLVAAGLCSASLLAGTVLAQNTLLQQASAMMSLETLQADRMPRLSRDSPTGQRGAQMAGHLDDAPVVEGRAAGR